MRNAQERKHNADGGFSTLSPSAVEWLGRPDRARFVVAAQMQPRRVVGAPTLTTLSRNSGSPPYRTMSLVCIVLNEGIRIRCLALRSGEYYLHSEVGTTNLLTL